MGRPAKNENGMKSKKEIREEIREKLAQQGDKERREGSRRIEEALVRLEEFRSARCVLIYVALPEEVDTVPVIEHALSLGKRIAVPRVFDGRALELREVRDIRLDLVKGAFGVLEPRMDRTRQVAAEEIDCAVVPGVAFDRVGRRLGRGRGYFDRLLATLPRSVPRIGLAFGFQVLDSLPEESHDQPVNRVLSS